MEKKLVLSVTINDCKVQTFRAGGPGGQKQNKTESGVRVIHEPSGARGECREERSQLQNKSIAFRRMAESERFRAWVYAVTRNLKTEDELMTDWLDPKNIKVEVKQGKNWIEADPE